MIFATVGTQLPFDRLLLALDTWASLNPGRPVVAQTGATDTRYAHLTSVPQLDQDRFSALVTQADVIVAHAGMGTILTALELGKPLILMPRLAALGEHRNDHQRDTAAEMSRLSNVTVVEDGAALCVALSVAVKAPGSNRPSPTAGSASTSLIEAIRSFIWDGPGHAPGQGQRQ
jgi:UDP-N-acetylglucosamine transferase subunit ALG13